MNTTQSPATKCPHTTSIDTPRARVQRRRPLAALLLTLSALALAAQLVAPSAASAQGIEIPTLSVGPAYRLVGTTATLTAKFAVDVGPTPYYNMIFDITSGQLVKACGSGTTCTATVTKSAATSRKYVAVRATYSTTYPAPNRQTSTSEMPITWRYSLVLNTSSTMAYSGSPVTLTATSATDVGPTPYYIQIFDSTSGARVKSCGTGTTCSVSVSNNKSTHSYVAYVAASGTTKPPPSIQSTSNGVSVNWYIIA